MVAPGIINEDKPSGLLPIEGDDASVGAFMGVAERGPLATPVEIRSFTQYQETFGGYMADSDLTYAVKGFFDEGGRRCYVSRLAHYTDITLGTHAGVAADHTLNDSQAVATLEIDAKYIGTYGNDLSIEVTSNPLVSNYNLYAPFLSGSDTISLTKRTGISAGQVLRVSQGDLPTTLAEAIVYANLFKAKYNSHLADATVHNSADATNVISAADATDLTTLIALLTEAQTDYNAHRVDAVVHNAADTVNTVTLAAPTDLVTCILVIAELAAAYAGHIADAAVHNSADVTNEIDVEVYGKVASVTTVTVGATIYHDVVFTAPLTFTGAGGVIEQTAGSVDSLEFDIKVYEDSVLVETLPQLSMESDTVNYAPSVINNTFEGGGSSYVAATDSASASGIGLNVPAAIIETSLTGGATEIGTGITAVDLIGSEVSSLGLNAFDGTEDIRIICAPTDSAGTADEYSQYDPAFITNALAYCSTRRDCFFIAEADHRLDVDGRINARELGGYNNSYGAMYTPRIKVSDPRSGATETTRYVGPAGHIIGKYALVDNITGPDGGTYNVAAGGSPHGNISTALGVEDIFSKAQRSSLNDASINAIRSRGSNGILIYGARTLYEAADFRYINVRRLFQFVENSVATSVEGKLFRNNNRNTWQQVKNIITAFLNDLWQDAGLKGASPSEAYYVKVGETDGVQTPADTLNGRMVVEIGLSPNRPAEFIIIRYEQTANGATLTIV